MQISLDKKSNIEYLEKEFGLHKFLPKSVLDAIKPKVLKKAIQQQFKKVKFSVYFLILTDQLERTTMKYGIHIITLNSQWNFHLQRHLLV